jgi:hypothetical protein
MPGAREQGGREPGRRRGRHMFGSGAACASSRSSPTPTPSLASCTAPALRLRFLPPASSCCSPDRAPPSATCSPACASLPSSLPLSGPGPGASSRAPFPSALNRGKVPRPRAPRRSPGPSVLTIALKISLQPSLRAIDESLLLLLFTNRFVYCCDSCRDTDSMEADDTEFLTAFEKGVLPRPEWTHRAHLRMAYLYLRPCPDADTILPTIRGRIRAYNAAQGNPDGYPRNDHGGVRTARRRTTANDTDCDLRRVRAASSRSLRTGWGNSPTLL